VVVVGRPNVGKSTLSNQMLGRSASIVADLPGTTRDWVAGLAELRPDPAGSDCGPAVETSICRDAVAVRWHDTPGLRRSEDLIEQQAIESVRHLIADADVVLAMRDLHTDWPLPTSMQRRPDLWLVNKIDLQMPAAMQGDGTTRNGALGISAVEGAGIDLLQQRVLATLDLKCVAEPRLWVFSNSLRLAVCDNGTEQLRDYVGL
jgi:tRNA modification GTPase